MVTPVYTKTFHVEDIRNILELLECPICREIPSNDILQCRSGHMICPECAKRVVHCPQNCGAPFKSLVRNRVVESIVDVLKVSCPHQEKGCTEILQKKDLEQHEKDCMYSGKRILFCKWLGYNDCCYLTNFKQRESVTDHLLKEHGAAVFNDNFVDVQIGNFKNIALDLNEDGMWAPTLINTSAGYQYIILTYFNSADKSVSWICLQTRGTGNLERKNEIDVRLGNLLSSKTFAWKMSPVTMLTSNSAEDLMKLAMPRVTIKKLMEVFFSTFSTEENDKNGSVLRMQFRIANTVYSDCFPKSISRFHVFTKKKKEDKQKKEKANERVKANGQSTAQNEEGRVESYCCSRFRRQSTIYTDESPENSEGEGMPRYMIGVYILAILILVAICYTGVIVTLHYLESK